VLEVREKNSKTLQIPIFSFYCVAKYINLDRQLYFIFYI